MTQLPRLTLNDWMEAETKLREKHITPQPKGSLTVEQYAQMRGRSIARCSAILRELFHGGFATREEWNNRFVYFLK